MSAKTAISTTLLGYRDDDKPILMAKNILESGDTGFPKANFSGVYADADGAHADYPTRNIHDRRRGTQWRHASASTRVFILLDAGAGGVLSADSLIIEGHESLLFGETIRVRCGDVLGVGGGIDAADPSTYTALSMTGDTINRVVSLWDYTYSARYWEIYFFDLGGGTSQWSAKQVWLGTSVFLPHHANVPYDEDGRQASFVDTQARSGARTRVSQWWDIRRREFECWVEDSDTIDDLRDAYDDAEGWAKAVWHIEYPTSEPATSALFGLMEEPSLALPSQLEIDRTWSNVIVEQGPHLD